jgi:hypothetical protein
MTLDDFELVPVPVAGTCHGCHFLVRDDLCDSQKNQCIETDRIWVPIGKPLPLPSSLKPTNPKDAIGIRKAPLSCVPMNVVAEMGLGMLEGACKYGRHNYRGVGVRGSVYFDATMRHLISWWEGEDVDPDSGLSHITKALVSLVVLRDAQMQDKCTDDRPPRSKAFYKQLNEKAATILDRLAVLEPPHHYTIEDTPKGQ